MSAHPIAARARFRLGARGRRPSEYESEELDDPREERGRHRREPDRDADRHGRGPRRRGGHGCDRIRGQGMRRRLD